MGSKAQLAPPRAAVLPPYAAALVVHGMAWRSHLGHDGQVPLFQPETHIGRLMTNDVILSDPAASRMHAVIRWTPDGYELEDLGSSGGTFIQGQPISGSAPLAPGQVITIGQTTMTFQALTAHHGPLPASGAAIPATNGANLAHGAAADPQPFVYRGQSRPGADRSGWWARRQHQHYWRVFLVGALGLVGTEAALSVAATPLLIGLVLTLGAALVPVTFLTYCWDQDFLADMPARVVVLTVVSGAVLGLALAIAVEMLVVHDNTFGSAVAVGMIEESAKAIAVVWFLRDRRLHNEIDGLILGAAAGAGFAILETIGYALTALNGGFGDGGGVGALNTVLLMRGLLAVFGHVTWTAIVVAAIWRERGQATFKLTGGVLLAFAIAVILHALWDGVPGFGVAFDAVVGTFILRFFILEAVAREELGSLAPPPPPLGKALLTYLRHPRWHPVARPSEPDAETFVGAWRVAPPAAPLAASAVAPAGAWPQAPAVVSPRPAPPAAPPAQGVRWCANGHAVHKPDVRFCPACGAPLSSPAPRH
jgi:protease PrsW